MANEQSNPHGILPFRQSGEFHYRWAKRYLDEDNVPGALHHLWQAVDMSPDNVGYSMELAGLLSDIERYDESNEILLMLMQNEEAPGECFYGLGCNFLGMGDLSNAEESLEQYLSRDPDGDFIEDAIVMLDDIEEHRREQIQPVDSSGSDESARRKAREGNKLLQAGEFRQAIRKLEEVDLAGEEDIAARNDLAVAYYYDGQHAEAARVARGILRDHPGQLQTMCNLALFVHKSDREEALRIIGQAAGAAGSDPLVKYRVGVVLCEMGEHEQARRAVESVAVLNPYDMRIQHYHALACYNSGQCKKAAGIWEQLRRTCPGSTVIGWYGRLAAARLRGDDVPEVLPYSMQVPVDEVIRRIREIGVRLQESQSLRDLGRDPEFRSLLLWGVTLKDLRLRRVMLQMLAAAGGLENERVLRRLLLSRHESDEFKKEIFIGLKAMNARQPFLALLEGNIVQVCVHVQKTGMGPAVKGYQDVIESLDRTMGGPLRERMDEAVGLWNRYLAARINRGKPLRVRTPAVWAAALHFCVARRYGYGLSLREAARRYGVSAGSVGWCVRRVQQQTDDDGR